MAKIFSAADIIQDSVNKNMETLLAAWHREIQDAAEALRERTKEINEVRGHEAQEAREKAYEQATANADAGRLLHFVTGALNLAESNDQASISIPSGVQVASVHLSGPSIANLMDMIGDLSEELAVAGEDQSSQSQQSALWALAHGYVPHASDLAQILKAEDKDPAWANRFTEFSQELKDLPREQTAPPQLKARQAHREVAVLKEYVANLQAFGGKNLATLVGKPQALSAEATLSSKIPPRSQTASKSSMNPAQFHRMLNELFSAKK